MDERNASTPKDAPADVGRRALLAAPLATYALSLVSSAAGQAAGDPGHAAFAGVSAYLTGHAALDPVQSSRLYDAFCKDNAKFPAEVQALSAAVLGKGVDPLKLQALLDAEHPALAPLPKKLLTAWYVGVVGEDDRARCITFETSLMNVAVSDHLRPPSYSFGGYGSWSEKPA